MSQRQEHDQRHEYGDGHQTDHGVPSHWLPIDQPQLVIPRIRISMVPVGEPPSQRWQDQGDAWRHQAAVGAGQRNTERRRALPGQARVCLLGSRPQVRVLLGAHSVSAAQMAVLPPPSVQRDHSSRVSCHTRATRRLLLSPFARLGLTLQSDGLQSARDLALALVAPVEVYQRRPGTGVSHPIH